MAAPRIAVVIPALDEEGAIGAVIREIPPVVHEVIVVDNGSRDRTADVARAAGATVVSEPRRGYGHACLAGIAAAGAADVLVFLDGDHSDYPAQLVEVVAPILDGRADLVIGSRSRGRREAGLRSHSPISHRAVKPREARRSSSSSGTWSRVCRCRPQARDSWCSHT